MMDEIKSRAFSKEGQKRYDDINWGRSSGEIIKVTDPEKVDSMVRHLNPEMDHTIIGQMGRRIHCDKCGGLASRVEIDFYMFENRVKFQVRCHGEFETCEMTYPEVVDVIEKKGVAVVFKQSAVARLTEVKKLLDQANEASE